MSARDLLEWPFHRNGQSARWQSASFLAAVSGATAAAGFWTVRQHPWPTTRIAPNFSSHPRLQFSLLVIEAIALLVCFIAGMAISSALVHWQERNESRCTYGLVLLLEACMLVGCGLLGTHLANHERLFLAFGTILFSLLLTLQSAMIRSLVNERRGTARTGGIVTDLGIELGNLMYETTTKKIASKQMTEGNRTRFKLLTSIVGFFGGGVLLGTLGFNQLDFAFYSLLAALLFFISAASLIANCKTFRHN